MDRLEQALSFIKTKEYDKAKSLLIDLYRKYPRNPDILFFLGIVSTRNGEYEQAILFLQKILELDIGYVDIRKVLLLLVFNFTKLGDYNDAITFAKKAYELHPSDITVIGGLGYLYYKLNDIEKAVSYLEKALEIAPDDHHLLNSLGYILADCDIDLTKAEKLCKKAISFLHDYYAYLDSLGWVYYKKGNLRLAKKYLQKAYHKNPNSEEIKKHIAKLLDI